MIKKIPFFFTICMLLVAFTNSNMAQTVDPNTLGLNGQVNAIVSDANYVYAGGDFTTTRVNTGVGAGVSMATANNLGLPKVVTGQIYAAITDGTGGWFIGGQFTTIGSTTKNNLAHILANGTVDASWNPNPDGNVVALAIYGTNLYVGGYYSSIGGQTRYNIAKISTMGTGAADATWAADTNPGGGVTTLAISGNGTDLYAGGSFNTIGGTSRNRIAKISAANTGAVDATWDPNANSAVLTLAISNTDLYIGGKFSNIGGKTRNSIAKIGLIANGTGLADATWNPNADNAVNTLAILGTNLYIGGTFQQISGHMRNRIARISLTTNTNGAADASWDLAISGTTISALAASGTDIYIGGHFYYTLSAKTYLFHAIKISGSTGTVDANWAPGPNDPVSALAISGQNIYMGGNFTTIAGPGRNNIARFIKTGTSLDLDPVWNPNVDNTINALALSTSGLYIGGFFKNVGGVSYKYLAKINTTAGLSGNVDSWTPPQLNDAVRALALSSADLYVGGQFKYSRGIKYFSGQIQQ